MINLRSAKNIFVPILLSLLILVALNTTPVEGVAGPHIAGSNITGCVGTNASPSTVKIDGRAFLGSEILRVSSTGSCANTETSLNLVTYNSTVLVSPSPTNTAAQNGTALLNALALINSASATNPVLLKIEPGVYDLGANSLTMKPYVDIEGSGESVTKITALGSATFNNGTIIGANNAELRLLTVESRGASFTNSGGVYSGNGITNTLKLTSITVISGGASSNNTGIYNNSAAPVMHNVTVNCNCIGTALNYGINNITGAVVLDGATVTVSSTINNYIEGIVEFNEGTPVMIRNANIKMTAVNGNAYGIYNFNANNTQPTIMQNNNINIDAGNGTGYGIFNQNATLITQNNTIFAKSTNNSAVGIGEFNTGSDLIENNTISTTVTTGQFAEGVLNNSTTFTATIQSNYIMATAVSPAICGSIGVNNFGITNIANTTIIANVDPSCGTYGVATQGNGVTKIENSKITGNTVILNATTNPVKIGSSQLDGPTFLAGSGTATCIFSYKTDFTALTGACG